MRRVVALPAFAALFWLGVGCTFLVSFDDVPTRDGGTDAGRRDARTFPTTEPTDDPPPLPRRDASTTPPPVPTCDPTFPLAQVTGCGSFIEGAQVCASNPGIGYPSGRDRTTDLVTCTRDGGVRASCVRHCPGIGGCAALPNGFPDQCDACTGRTDGLYCGLELGWPSRILVTCSGGRMSARVACPLTCSNGACD